MVYYKTVIILRRSVNWVVEGGVFCFAFWH